MSANRASEQMGGKLTLGKNAVVVGGEGVALEVGQDVAAEIDF